MNDLAKVLLETLLSGVFISLFLGYFITKRDERIKNEIQEEFKKRDIFFNAQLNFKQRALEELLGPVTIQLTRSSITLDAYKSNDEYRESILRKCNETIRDLLLAKSFLIPTELVTDAAELIKHYDDWLQAYDRLRVKANDKSAPFVFTFNFPKQAEVNFIDTYEKYRSELKVEEKLK